MYQTIRSRSHLAGRFAGLLAALSLAACAAPPPAAAPTAPAATQAVPPATAPTHNLSGCAESYDASTDYFPEKSTPKDAAGFKIEYFKNYKIITVLNPWQGAKQTFKYLLLQCGTPAPKDAPSDAFTIQIPVKTVVSMSTTELPQFEKLGLLDRLVGLDSLDYASNKAVRALIKAGKLQAITDNGVVNVEKAIALKPDLILTYGMGDPQYDAHPKLLEAKLPTALDGSYVENTPLGRAEWIKFTAAFFNAEAKAESTHAEIAARYTALAAKARAAADKPTVLVGTPNKDNWYIPGGASYAAALYADAGAKYLWSDDTATGSLPFSFEQVLDKGAAAQVWLLNAYETYTDTAALAAADPKYSAIAALKTGSVWNNDKALNEAGGNDFYEGGAANPDLMLSDLVYIMHPTLLPSDYQPLYYRKLGK